MLPVHATVEVGISVTASCRCLCCSSVHGKLLHHHTPIACHMLICLGQVPCSESHPVTALCMWQEAMANTVQGSCGAPLVQDEAVHAGESCSHSSPAVSGLTPGQEVSIGAGPTVEVSAVQVSRRRYRPGSWIQQILPLPCACTL